MVIKASINVIPECPISEIVEIAKEAEMLGFSRCWVYDEGLATRDVYVVMSAIASATQNIEIGPGITILTPDIRHKLQWQSLVLMSCHREGHFWESGQAALLP